MQGEEFRSLQEGDKVTLDIEQSPRGPQATDVRRAAG
ncbi:MAG: cold shock domain-containing protein [Deltaproteobacteria bacterium]|nr:cold shock domain-containing protein [Deltaproteobacteria bacterium]